MSVKYRIEDALNVMQRDLVANYDKLGLRASGKWATELENFYSETSTGYQFGIKGAGYTGALQGGRKPSEKGNKPGILRQTIRQWIDDKGIVPKDGITKDSLAFLITRKIHNEGIKVPNFFNQGGLVSDVINDEAINKFADIIKFSIIENARSEVKGILNGNN